MSDDMPERQSGAVAEPVVMRPWMVCRAMAAIAAIAGVAYVSVDPTFQSFGLAVIGVGLAVTAATARLDVAGGFLRRRGVMGWGVPLDLREVNRVRLHYEVRYWRDLPHRVLRLATPDREEYISLRWWTRSGDLLATLRIELSAPGATSVSHRIWTIDIDEDSKRRIDVI